MVWLIAPKASVLREHIVMNIPVGHQVIDDHPECFAFIDYLKVLLKFPFMERMKAIWSGVSSIS